MKNETKYNVLTLAVGLFTLLLISIGVSFAYFTATVTGAETNTTITVGGGTMEITYAGGSALSANNIHPQAAAVITKTFTVTGSNTTGSDMNYNLSIIINTNTFSNNALKYDLSGTITGGNGTLVPAKTKQNINGTTNINLGNGKFEGVTGAGKVHNYTLAIFFLDTGTDQNIDKGKSFTGRIGITAVQ